MDIVVKLTPPAGAEYPRPRGVKLRRDQLEPADVLLSRGSTEISNAIVAADGASYSHAALWGGEQVIEAIIDGVFERDLCGERDVYRYVDVLPRTAAEDVLKIAREHVGQRYAHSELLLLGTLFSVGVIPARPLLNVAIEALGGPNARHLAVWLNTFAPSGGPVMCSELVARSYYEVSATRDYALQIVTRKERAPNPALRPRRQRHNERPSDDARSLQRACSQLLRGGTSAVDVRERKLLFGELAQRLGTQEALGVVTPGDLQFSPSLRFIGRIEA